MEKVRLSTGSEDDPLVIEEADTGPASKNGCNDTGETRDNSGDKESSDDSKYSDADDDGPDGDYDNDADNDSDDEQAGGRSPRPITRKFSRMLLKRRAYIYGA